MTKNQNSQTKGDNQYTVHISLLPLLVIIALIVGAGYFLTAGELPELRTNRMEIRRMQDSGQALYPLEHETSKILEKKRLVVTSKEQLDEFFEYIDPDRILEFRDNTDFSKEYLLIASTKTLPTTGHTFKIYKVRKDSDDETLKVEVNQVKPGKLCSVEETPNVWVDIIAIPKTDWDIEYDTIVSVNDRCDEVETQEL